MEFSWRFLRCPGCNRIYNWHIEKILYFFKAGSGLGPPNVRCASCGTVFASGLQEWQQMTMSQKFRYGFMSLLYSLFIGLCLTFPAITIVGKITQYGDPSFPSGDLIAFSLVVFSLPTVFIQILRVLLSMSRSESITPEPMDVSFWNWQINLQFFGLAICFFSMLAFVLIPLVVK